MMMCYAAELVTVPISLGTLRLRSHSPASQKKKGTGLGTGKNFLPLLEILQLLC